MHWLYGTTVNALKDVDDGSIVADAGDRVLFVYPMRSDEESGAVTMRLKKVHPVSARLTYHWVEVYSGPAEGMHHVRDFSFVP